MFDPTYGPLGEHILDKTRQITIVQSETRAEMGAGFSRMEATLPEVSARLAVPLGCRRQRTFAVKPPHRQGE